ncbi:MAG: hypothetical protein L3J15_08945 [Devosiaceae bacterium]|nr:hypothetical protein [Devosiaceae bacterium]
MMPWIVRVRWLIKRKTKAAIHNSYVCVLTQRLYTGVRKATLVIAEGALVDKAKN